MVKTLQQSRVCPHCGTSARARLFVEPRPTTEAVQNDIPLPFRGDGTRRASLRLARSCLAPPFYFYPLAVIYILARTLLLFDFSKKFLSILRFHLPIDR